MTFSKSMCATSGQLNFSNEEWFHLQTNCTALSHVLAASEMTQWNATVHSTQMPFISTVDTVYSWRLTPSLTSRRYSSLPVFILVAVFMGLVILVTACGNLMVGIALYRYKNLRTMSNLLIGNLALSDFLLATTVVPISTVHDLLGYWIFGEVMCTIWLCIDVLYCTASIWGLCTIAVDRYTATIYPMWYHEQRSPKRALVYVIFVWLFSLIVSFAPFIGWRDMIPYFYQHDKNTQTYDCILFMLQSYVMYSAFGSFVIPFWLMLFLYIRIFIALHKRSIELQKKASIHFPRSVTADTSSQFVNDSLQPPCENESFELQTVVTKDSLTGTTSSEQNEDYQAQNKGNLDYSKSDDADDCKSLSPGDASDKDLIPKKTNNGIMMANNSRHAAEITANSNHDRHAILSPSYSQISDSEHDSELENKHRCKALKGNHYKRLSLQPSPISVRTKFIKSVSINLEDLSVEDYNSSYDEQKQKHKSRLRRASKHFLSLPWSTSCKPLGRSHLTASMKRRFELREQRATKRMALIMVCFIVCWMPFFLMYIARSLCNHCYVNYHLQAALTWLGYVNSALNPILYTIFNEDFRRAFQRMLGLSQPRQAQKRP